MNGMNSHLSNIASALSTAQQHDKHLWIMKWSLMIEKSACFMKWWSFLALLKMKQWRRWTSWHVTQIFSPSFTDVQRSGRRIG